MITVDCTLTGTVRRSKMGSSSTEANRFTYSYSDEPHATRRKLILQKYPQVKKLMGVDEAFKW